MAPRCVRRSAVYCQSTARAEAEPCSPGCRRLLRSDQMLEGHAANRGGHGRVTDRQCQPRSDRRFRRPAHRAADASYGRTRRSRRTRRTAAAMVEPPTATARPYPPIPTRQYQPRSDRRIVRRMAAHRRGDWRLVHPASQSAAVNPGGVVPSVDHSDDLRRPDLDRSASRMEEHLLARVFVEDWLDIEALCQTREVVGSNDFLERLLQTGVSI